VQLSRSLAQTDLAKMPISTSWLRNVKCLLLSNIEVHHHRRLKVVYLSFHYSYGLLGGGALKMRDWKMRDWNYREQETYETLRVA